MKRTLMLVLATLGLTMMVSPASADTINLTLDSPPTTAAAGTELDFTATVSAPITNGAPVFMNSDSTSIDYPLTLDDSDFFNNFPLSLNPGDSFTDVMFTVDIPSYVNLYVPYDGYFEIDGGADGNASGDLASVTFTIVPTPEPGSIVLMLTGLSGFATALRRKHRTA